MQTITETIDQLTHEELKAYCIKQNQNNLDLMAEVERLKAELSHGKRLANKLLDEIEAIKADAAFKIAYWQQD